MEKSRINRIKGFFILMALTATCVLWDDGHSIFQIGSDRTGAETFFGEINEYSSGNGSISRGSIKGVEVDWKAGEIEIIEYDGEDILFIESADSKIINSNKMKYLSKNGNLVIRYNGNIEEKYTNKIQKKNLQLKIPQKDAHLIKEIKINSISTKITINTGNIQKLKIGSTNGEMQIYGNYKDLEMEGVSGDILMELSSCPEKLKVQTLNGDIRLAIPENKGFSLECERMDGNFECDFPLTSENKFAIYKKSKSTLKLGTINGNIKIEKRD